MTDRLFPLTTYSSAITVLASLGISVDAIAEMASIPAGVLVDPHAMVTARQFHEFAALGRSLFNNDPAFGLNVAEFVRLDMVEVFGPLFATTATLRTYLEDAVRFMPLVDPCIDLVLEVDGDEARVVCTTLPEQGADARFFHAEATFSVGFRVLQSVFRRPELSPLRIEMQHDGSAWLDAYHKHFGAHVPVLFRRERNLVAFAAPLLDLANPGHSPVVNAQMQKIALARLAALPRMETYTVRVLRFLEEESGRRVLDLADVAEHLGITTRTLQRRLVEEKTTFQTLRDTLRHREACRLLSQSDCDVATIAATLGFSEPATFQRAFKTWSGLSPGEYRKRQTGQA
jgi:AraC-like DNA-binding protein